MPEPYITPDGQIVHLDNPDPYPIRPFVGRERELHLCRAALGIGPAGTQQVVVVVAPTERPRRPDLAPGALAERVRAAACVDVAAVFAVSALPVDKRHNSKIDRTRVATWASAILAGGRMRAL